MKTILSIIVLSISLTILSSCSKIVGHGSQTTETRNVPSFTSIESEFMGDVILVQDATQSVKVEAQANLIDKIYTTVTNNKLTIKLKPGIIFSPTNKITVYIATPTIQEINLKGSGNLTVQKNISTSDININLTGSGNILINSLEAVQSKINLTGSGNLDISVGNTEQLTTRIDGSGNANLKKYESQFADITVTGSGSATITAIQTLNATISGSGDITYYGNPIVETSITGSGNITHQN